jgi:D-alanyl-D-alanine dipeptidase
MKTTISGSLMTERRHAELHEVDFVNLAALDSSLRFDIRYARNDNFLKRAVYPSAHAFLLKHVAFDLLNVHEALAQHGFGLLIFDGYRPWDVTKIFWDESNEHDRKFLADPAQGSSHNRGCAVDLSMADLKTGLAVTMPSDFDEMNEKSYVDYVGGEPRARELRDLLQATMKSNSFTGIQNEWWHFNHASHRDFPNMNHSFQAILDKIKTPR